MNQLIRAIGSFVVACIIFACPVCLTLIFVFGKATEMPCITFLLFTIVAVEFASQVLYFAICS